MGPCLPPDHRNKHWSWALSHRISNFHAAVSRRPEGFTSHSNSPMGGKPAIRSSELEMQLIRRKSEIQNGFFSEVSVQILKSVQ